MRKRPGISLLEVMFSMGVIAVGLLGVTAILPLALNQIGQGRVLDNASRVGQNAATEFHVREMGNYLNWRRIMRISSGANQLQDVGPARFTNPNQGFCIDPLFYSVNTNYAMGSYDANLFPYYSRPVGTEPRMNRISLAAANPNGIMMWSGAERIFVLQDELVFDIPEEKTAPPIQNFGSSGANRMYNGSTSWLATLSPNLDVVNQTHDSFVLSVVVFDNRNMAMPIDGDSERLLSVLWGSSSGLGGGDMVLQSPTLEGLVGIRSGKWFMLMGNARTNVKPMPQFRWYRVVTTDKEPVFNTMTSMFHLNVTAQGPDWDPNTATSCAFLPGVVSVYERSIRLESGTLWEN